MDQKWHNMAQKSLEYWHDKCGGNLPAFCKQTYINDFNLFVDLFHQASDFVINCIMLFF